MDRQEKIKVNNIPAILYGPASDRLYLYVHGKLSRKEEAEHFASIAEKSGYQVLSFDLPEHGERASEQYSCTTQNGVHDLNDMPEGNISWHRLWFILYLLIFSLLLIPVF